MVEKYLYRLQRSNFFNFVYNKKWFSTLNVVTSIILFEFIANYFCLFSRLRKRLTAKLSEFEPLCVGVPPGTWCKKKTEAVLKA